MDMIGVGIYSPTRRDLFFNPMLKRNQTLLAKSKLKKELDHEKQQRTE